ncbi:hypothetical protein [Streptodolium elevatio]|uniref:Uncharacterized protein n=1 Tax=Streptodolium elevatio TaxID=3157996 RepID=A0ABV3DRA5_9ACTN
MTRQNPALGRPAAAKVGAAPIRPQEQVRDRGGARAHAAAFVHALAAALHSDGSRVAAD